MVMKSLMSTRLSAIVGELVVTFMNFHLASCIRMAIFLQLFPRLCGSCLAKNKNRIGAKLLRSAWMAVMNGLILGCVRQTELAWVQMGKSLRQTTRENGFPEIN